MERIWKTYEDMNEVIYAADMDTHELLFLNKRARELYGITSNDEVRGKKCYQLLQNNAAPCAMCTNDRIQNGEQYQWEYFNQILKKRFVLKDHMITHEGRRIRVEIADVISNENENHRYHGIDEMSLLINECMRMSLEKTDSKQGINQMLEYLGITLLGERVYIFELSESNEWNNTYEWCANNVTAEIENLKNIPYDTTEIWNREFEKDHFVIIPDIEEIKESDAEVYDYLAPQNIHSIIVGPLYKDNKVCGFYGVDNPPRERIEKIASMLKTIGHVIESMIEKRNLVRRLEELSYYDQMSHLGNRFALDKYLYSLDCKKSLGIAYCDVIGIRQVNDTMGHAAGDKMLLLACKSMKEVFEGCELFRIGGDELLAVANGIDEERFKQQCAKMKALMRHQELHVAMGRVWVPKVEVNPKELIDKADALMYSEKRSYYDTARMENSSFYNEIGFAHKYMDSLTGGYTRQGFIREVEQIFQQSLEENKYAILAVDIRKFKSINDIFGHSGGDKLLNYLYQLLKSDSKKIRVVGRLEADWFVCLVEREKLELNKLENVLNFSWFYEGRLIQVGLYCGIYFVDDYSIPVNSMIEWAILAKQSTNKEIRPFAIFDEKMRSDYVSKAEIISSFQRGIRNEEFKVYYQPIVQLSTNHVVAAEALVRWQHAHLGFISPAQFIPILESNGMITELDHFVLQKVNKYLERVSETNLPLFSVAINLSWQDFYDQKMVDDIIHIASARCNENRRINFEVTETSLSALEQNCGYILKQFQECGSRVLLDDFGSGVSSLGMIGNYSFDIIKIDRSFISQIGSNEKIRNIIQSIIQMCHNVGLKTIGEGVETKEELAFLKAAKCDYVQGYYFAKPMPEEEFNQYVREHGLIDYNDKQVQLGVAIMNQPVLNEDFYKKILDRVDKFVAVINPEDYSLIYLNKTAQKSKGESVCGEKCYYRMERLDKPCVHCVMKHLKYDNERKITVGSGDELFDVTASIWEINGKKVFVEIGGVRQTENAATDYISQMKNIVEVLPNQRGVFHIDVTEDRLISLSGKSELTDSISIGSKIDTIVCKVASMIEDSDMQKEFFTQFNRDAMMQEYKEGHCQHSKDLVLCCENGVLRQIRVMTNLVYNVATEHIEGLIYGVDISEEYNQPENEELGKDDFFTMYQQADHDRRIDYLTGLRNRLDLNEQFTEFEESDETAGTVYMIDIDDFKNINDRHGHLVGDQCLKAFGEVLSEYGEEHGITFFRYGGEEVLGIDRNNRENAPEVSRDILERIKNIEIETESGKKLTFTVSVGYARQSDSLKKMIQYADKAMYISKKKGKNCFSEYLK